MCAVAYLEAVLSESRPFENLGHQIQRGPEGKRHILILQHAPPFLTDLNAMSLSLCLSLSLSLSLCFYTFSPPAHPPPDFVLTETPSKELVFMAR